MHLNDSQLLEPSSLEQKHIERCNICKEKLVLVERFRNRLENIEDKNISTDLFLRIVRSNDPYQKNIKLSFWKKSTYALAATIAFVSLFGVYQWSNYGVPAGNLESLIALNNEVQNSISEISSTTSNVSHWQNDHYALEKRIHDIDIEIQKAYLENSSNDKIYQLWKTRLGLLEEFKRMKVKKRTLVRI